MKKNCEYCWKPLGEEEASNYYHRACVDEKVVIDEVYILSNEIEELEKELEKKNQRLKQLSPGISGRNWT